MFVRNVSEQIAAKAAADASLERSAIATAKSNEAGNYANAADADRIAAQTARGGAELAETRSVQARDDAAGHASSASASRLLSAESERAAQLALAATFPEQINGYLIAINASSGLPHNQAAW